MTTPTQHTCDLPDLATWPDHDDDWVCPVCKQGWWVSSKNYCHSCLRSDGPVWEKYGNNPGGSGRLPFPLVQAPRGGIVFDMTRAKP